MTGEIDIGRVRMRARALSKSLFGAQFRAEIAAYVGVGSAPFWARGMAQPLAIPENKVAAELTRFAAGGLLTALPGDAWDRRRLYVPMPAHNRYWEAGYHLIEQAAAQEALRAGVDTATAMQAYVTVVHGSTLEPSRPADQA